MVGSLNAGTGGAQTKSSGGNVEEIRNQEEEAKNRAAESRQIAAQARARAAAEKSAGTSAVGAGNAQAVQGGIQTAGGVATGAIGYYTKLSGAGQVSAGTAAVAAAKPLLSNPLTAAAGAAAEAAGQSQIATGKVTTMTGYGMVITGAGQVAMGAMTLASGNQKISQGTSQLAQAAEQGVISKQEASIANKEMIRSQIFESKRQMLEETMATLQNEGKLEGANGENLSPEEIEKLKATGAEGFDKAFTAGADAMKNGGIMSLQDGDKTRFFIEGDDGIEEVNILKDSTGKPATDKYGRLQIDEDTPVSNASPLSDDKKLELKLNFAVMNQMKDMITGDSASGIPGLARIQIDPDTGAVTKGTFNLNNPQHMKEFAQLVDASTKEPKPAKLIEEDGKVYLQPWNWETNQPAGDKVSIQDMSGGTIDKSDPDWLEKAKATSSAAFEKVGLGSGSAAYALLQPLAAESESNDKLRLSSSEFKDFITGLRPKVGGNLGDSSGFRTNNSDRFSSANGLGAG